MLYNINFFSMLDPMYAPINEGNKINPAGPSKLDMENAMARNETTWYLLASGIPARSFAVGANSIRKLNEDEGGVGRNYDMQGLRDIGLMDGEQPDWPAERDDLLRNKYDFDWFHSDLRDVALPYVYDVFDKFVHIIEEKED